MKNNKEDRKFPLPENYEERSRPEHVDIKNNGNTDKNKK